MKMQSNIICNEKLCTFVKKPLIFCTLFFITDKAFFATNGQIQGTAIKSSHFETFSQKAVFSLKIN